MARRRTKTGPAETLVSYGILALLGLIAVWLLVQQSRFNPAVLVATRPPELQGRPQAVAGGGLSAAAALLPEVSGFTPLGPPESYGPENLSDKINGKAELYLAAGFKAMSCRAFSLGGLERGHLEVFLYDMGSAPNAFAVFSSQRRPGSPDLSLAAHAYATGNALFFSQGRFYVELVGDRASEALTGSLQAYAAALLGNLPPEEGAAPNLVELFPREGLAPDTARLCPTDVFGLEGLHNVCTAEYSLESGKATGFIAARQTPAEAQAEARRYLEFLAANGYQKVQVPESQGDISVLTMDNSFELVFTQGRALAGVHDATSLKAALELAQKLRPVLVELGRGGQERYRAGSGAKPARPPSRRQPASRAS
jgi:hypothetical protein